MKKKNNTITIQTIVHAPMTKVWEYWNNPKHLVGWVFASDDWEALSPENDLRVDGKLKITMATKDKSQSFDFVLTYTAIKEMKLLESIMDDGRHVAVFSRILPKALT